MLMPAKSRVVLKQTEVVPRKIEIAPVRKVERRLRLGWTLSSRPRLVVQKPVPEVVQHPADKIQISF